MSLSSLQSRLGYEFRNAELLRQALTHRSHSATHNERLEFLGDSVLNCAVAALLFVRFGRLDEGDLSRVRANLVKQQSLYEIAQALNVADGLRLGEGELRSGGRRRPSILADALEAIIGAIFMDGGFDAAQALIKRLYEPILDHIDPRTLGKDAKTLLQEYLQGHQIALPAYTVVATSGAAHIQQFEVECAVPKFDVKVSGAGASRRAAEQIAAKKALEEVMARIPKGKSHAPQKMTSTATAATQAAETGVAGGNEDEGIQGDLDLRSPRRRARVVARNAKPKLAPRLSGETATTVAQALALAAAEEKAQKEAKEQKAQKEQRERKEPKEKAQAARAQPDSEKDTPDTPVTARSS